MKTTVKIIPAVILLVSLSLAAQDNAPAADSHFNTAPTFSERYPRYKLSASDTFDVIFEYTPEYNQSVIVQPDGYVSMRNVGDVYVNGLTVEQVTQKMQESYGKILNKPVVSINLRDFQRPYFIADGMVNRPGKFELRGDTTVSQAIAMAGGFNSQWAKHSNVVVFRRVDDQWVETKVVNVKQMEKTGDLSEDVHLRPGDLVFVPKNTTSKLQQWIPIYSVSMLGAQTKTF